MDIGRIGWNQAGLNALAIGLVYVAAGYVVVWLDGRLAFRRGVG
jgi:hypothetical protein